VWAPGEKTRGPFGQFGASFFDRGFGGATTRVFVGGVPPFKGLPRVIPKGKRGPAQGEVSLIRGGEFRGGASLEDPQGEGGLFGGTPFFFLPGGPL